jgi:hypothetical protein
MPARKRKEPMPDDLLTLARLFVALPRWEWRPGMRFFCPSGDPLAPYYEWRITNVRPGQIIAYEEVSREVVRWTKGDDGWRSDLLCDMGDECGAFDRGWSPIPISRNPPPPQWLPDLADPATLGAILGLVREAYKDPHAYVMFSRVIGAWVFSTIGRDPIESYVSEPAALKGALPCPKN